MATFTIPPVPQDQMIVGPGGVLSPAWYQFFLAIQRAAPEQIKLAEQADATQKSAADGIAALNAKPVIARAPRPAIANIAATTIAVTSPDASGGNASTDTLANEMKGDLNALIGVVNGAIADLAAIKAALRNLGLLEE